MYFQIFACIVYMLFMNVLCICICSRGIRLPAPILALPGSRLRRLFRKSFCFRGTLWRAPHGGPRGARSRQLLRTLDSPRGTVSSAHT